MFGFALPVARNVLMCFALFVAAHALAAQSPIDVRPPEPGLLPSPVLQVMGVDGAVVVDIDVDVDPALPAPTRVELRGPFGALLDVAEVALLPSTPGLGQAKLPGALALVAEHGPAFQLRVYDAQGFPIGADFPYRVILDCPDGAIDACQLRVRGGLYAAGRLVVSPALAEAIDEITPGLGDQDDLWSAIDLAFPALRGETRDARWQIASLEMQNDGATPGCDCYWMAVVDLGLSAGAEGEECGAVRSAQVTTTPITSAAAHAESVTTEIDLRLWCVDAALDANIAWLDLPEPITIEMSSTANLCGAPPCSSVIAQRIDHTRELYAVREGLEASAYAALGMGYRVDGQLIVQRDVRVDAPTPCHGGGQLRWQPSVTDASAREAQRTAAPHRALPHSLLQSSVLIACGDDQQAFYDDHTVVAPSKIGTDVAIVLSGSIDMGATRQDCAAQVCQATALALQNLTLHVDANAPCALNNQLPPIWQTKTPQFKNNGSTDLSIMIGNCS
ncbi:MAG: hypothetical protein AAF772_02820 [Acidobacteriota bacterium]